MFTKGIREQVSQGDIFREMPFALMGQDETQSIRITNLILLSHDCDYDKLNNPYCLVAVVGQLALVPPEDRENIRRYKVINTFYIDEIPRHSQRVIRRYPPDFYDREAVAGGGRPTGKANRLAHR